MLGVAGEHGLVEVCVHIKHLGGGGLGCYADRAHYSPIKKWLYHLAHIMAAAFIA